MSTLAAAADSMRGTLHGSDHTFDGVSTDTRTLRRGELFVALQGPNFDGRDYIAQACDKGAAGAVVDALVEDESAQHLAQVVVNDSKRALGHLGAAWRDQTNATVIGVTGSNGKTTLKEMTARCLETAAPTIATHGNLNNDIGMPLMLTRIDAAHRFAVLEMGANHAGEIAYLAALAKPDIVVITNAAAAHLEGFGSVDGVARAKGEILAIDVRPKIAILNADDRYFEHWASLVEDVRLISFGIDEAADVHAEDVYAAADHSTFDLCVPGAEIGIKLPIAGRHNVRNACAAAAIAIAVGIDIVDIKAALESMQAVTGRLQRVAGINGSTIFDDSYNANPVSVTAAAEFLASIPGENWLVLGDMAELGDDAPRLHREVGEQAAKAGIKRLFATGSLSRNTVDGFGDGATWFPSPEVLSEALADEIGANSNVLIKGSRSSRMERVVAAIRAAQVESVEA
ncbi:MAG: UDP-N-acetylmuramoyl-tripeptide--D-alanyl-D-alanine ligase [Woeseiaceae bacterium]